MPSALGSAVFSMTANTAGLSAGFSKALAITTAGLAGIGALVAMHAKRTQSEQHGTRQAREKAALASEKAALASSQREAMRDLGEGQRIDKRMMMDTHKEELAKAKMAGINQINAAYLTNTHARALLGLTEAHRKDTLAMRESHIAAQAAMAAEQDLSGGITMTGMASAATTVAVVALTAALTGMAAAAAKTSVLRDVISNVGQTFGSNSKMIEDAADRQVAAFGRVRSEMLGYAESVGRQLINLGVDADTAATLAAGAMEAASRLAASRHMSPEAAMKQIQTGEGLYAQTRVRALAWEKKFIKTRNAAMAEGLEAALRYRLGIEAVNEQTQNLQATDESWSNQMASITGRLSNLATEIGTSLAPEVQNLISDLAGFIDMLKSGWTWLVKWETVMGEMSQGTGFDEALRIAETRIADMNAAVSGQGGAGAPGTKAEQDKIRRQMKLGFALGSGGGSGGGGYQGGIAGYHRQIQEMAFSLRQEAVAENQLAELKKQTALMQQAVGLPMKAEQAAATAAF